MCGTHHRYEKPDKANVHSEVRLFYTRVAKINLLKHTDIYTHAHVYIRLDVNNKSIIVQMRSRVTVTLVKNQEVNCAKLLSF